MFFAFFIIIDKPIEFHWVSHLITTTFSTLAEGAAVVLLSFIFVVVIDIVVVALASAPTPADIAPVSSHYLYLKKKK